MKGYFGWLRRWFVPDSHFRKGWSGLLFFSNLFNVFITPVWFAVMLEPIDYYVAPLGLCYLIDILFWIDFYFQARCYYYMQDGVLVTNDLQLWMKFREKYAGHHPTTTSPHHHTTTPSHHHTITPSHHHTITGGGGYAEYADTRRHRTALHTATHGAGRLTRRPVRVHWSGIGSRKGTGAGTACARL